MTLMDDIQERLVELARLQRDAKRLIDPLNAQVSSLSAQIADINAKVESCDRQLRDDILAYMQATGDLHVHPSVTFRRTVKLVYDQETVLQQLLDEGIELPIRTKKELNVRIFEKAWREGQYRFVDAEEVDNPTVAIDKLGDLLILLGEDS